MLLRYGAVAILSAFAGFLLAWQVFRMTTEDSSELASQAREHFQSPMSPGQKFPTLERSNPALRPDATMPPSFDDIAAGRNVFEQLLAAWQLAADSDITTLRDLATASLSNPDPMYKDNIVAIFIERMIAIDPLAAMAFVESDYRLNNAAMKGHVITSWVRADAEAAMQ